MFSCDGDTMYEWKRFALLLMVGRRGPAVSKVTIWSWVRAGTHNSTSIVSHSYSMGVPAYLSRDASSVKRCTLRGLAAAPCSYRVKTRGGDKVSSGCS